MVKVMSSMGMTSKQIKKSLTSAMNNNFLSCCKKQQRKNFKTGH